MRLVCKILECVASRETEGPVAPPRINGYSDAQVHYHIGLCREAGYVDVDTTKASIEPGVGRRFYSIGLLTWHGHEALDRLCPPRS